MIDVDLAETIFRIYLYGLIPAAFINLGIFSDMRMFWKLILVTLYTLGWPLWFLFTIGRALRESLE